MKDLLAFPAFWISLCSFVISAWTANQIGCLDFARRRQDFLTQSARFKNDMASYAKRAFDYTVRLGHAIPDSAPDDLQSRVLKEDLEQRFIIMSTISKEIDVIVESTREGEKRIAALKPSLRTRVELEELVGSLERAWLTLTDKSSENSIEVHLDGARADLERAEANGVRRHVSEVIEGFGAAAR